jgi:hypothetical protein
MTSYLYNKSLDANDGEPASSDSRQQSGGGRGGEGGLTVWRTGVRSALVDSTIYQEIKEAMLAYFFLWVSKGPLVRCELCCAAARGTVHFHKLARGGGASS